MKYSDKQIETLIAGIENGTITEDNLPVDYYESLVEYLKSGLFKGFGATLETVSTFDEPLLKELLTNVYHFGAAKSYQQTVEMTKLLVDEDGVIRSSKEFNQVARELYDNWNDNYGRTDYNTAIGSGDMAAKWQDIQANKDVVPNLRYSAVGDACPICAPLDNLVAPVDDPVWDDIYPLNHPNCFCVVVQVEDAVSEGYKGIVSECTEKMDDTFINNVGKTGQVFPKGHPYFDAPKSLKENNFGLEMPSYLED